MRLFITFWFCFFQLALYSQINEKSILKANHELFKSIKQNLDAISSNEKSIAYLDSLKNTISNPYLKNRIDIFRADSYRSYNLSQTFAILKNIEDFLAKNPNLTHLKTHYYIVFARAFYESGKYNESLEKYLLAQKTASDFKDPEDLWRYPIESKTGVIANYVYLARNEEAIALLKELEKTVSPNDKLDEYIYVLNMLGYLHTKSGNYNDGIKYFSEITKLTIDKAPHQESYFSAVNNLAYIFQLTEKRHEAIKIMTEALEQTKKHQMVNRELLLSNNLGFLYLEEDDLDKAEGLGLISAEKSKLKFKEIETEAQRLLAKVYYEKGNIETALIYANNAAEYFREINDLKRLKDVLSIKNKILIKNEDFKEATEVNSEMIALMDSLTIKNDMQNLQKTLVAFETEKKDNEITILKQKEELNALKIKSQKAQINYLVIALFALIFFGSTVFIYQRRIDKYQNLALRSKLTRAQFNPHYINNAFASLQAELLSHKFDERLIDYTSNISRFSRLMLESTFKDEWTLNEEKQMICNYLETQEHRLNSSFEYSITTHNLDKNDLAQIIIPSAISQSVIENAIEHGGSSHSASVKKVDIVFSKKNQFVYINVKNTITKPTINTLNKLKEQPSRGLEITKQRVTLHGKIHKKATSFDINVDDYDFEVSFKFPIIAA